MSFSTPSREQQRMNSSQSMFNLSSVSSPQYVASHLSQSQHKRAGYQVRASPPNLRRSSTTSRFGGPSFGTPKTTRTTSRSQESSAEDAPPIGSIYDYEGGAPFVSSSVNTNNESASASQTTLPTTSIAGVPTSVIIFGFPTHLTSQVLAQFSRYGKIEEHASSNQGISVGNNWMRITYQDATAAQQAVAANGTQTAGQYMVGCVYAQEDALTNVDQTHSDAMDIDPMTPPRQKALQQLRQNSNTGSSDSTTKKAHLGPGTPGRKIELLSTDTIYKSHSPITEKATAWMPSWISGNTTDTGTTTVQAEPERPQATSWSSRLVRGLVDTIFGF